MEKRWTKVEGFDTREKVVTMTTAGETKSYLWGLYKKTKPYTLIATENGIYRYGEEK